MGRLKTEELNNKRLFRSLLQKYTKTDIAKHYGVTLCTISQKAKKMGLQDIRPKKEDISVEQKSKRKYVKKNIVENEVVIDKNNEESIDIKQDIVLPTKEELVDLLDNKHLSYSDIAKLYNVRPIKIVQLVYIKYRIRVKNSSKVEENNVVNEIEKKSVKDILKDKSVEITPDLVKLINEQADSLLSEDLLKIADGKEVVESEKKVEEKKISRNVDFSDGVVSDVSFLSEDAKEKLISIANKKEALKKGFINDFLTDDISLMTFNTQRDIRSFTDCPNSCNQGVYYDITHNEANIPCDVCAEKRRLFVKSNKRDKRTGKTFFELMNIPVLDEEARQKILLKILPEKYASVTYTKTSIIAVSSGIKKVTKLLKQGESFESSMFFYLGDYVRLDLLASKFISDAYIRGLDVAPFITAELLYEMRPDEIYMTKQIADDYAVDVQDYGLTYNQLLKKDIVIVVVDIGSRLKAKNRVLNLLQGRARNNKPTIILSKIPLKEWNGLSMLKRKDAEYVDFVYPKIYELNLNRNTTKNSLYSDYRENTTVSSDDLDVAKDLE